MVVKKRGSVKKAFNKKTISRKSILINEGMLKRDIKGAEVNAWWVVALLVAVLVLMISINFPEGIRNYTIDPITKLIPSLDTLFQTTSGSSAQQWQGQSFDISLARGMLFVLAFLLCFSIVGIFKKGLFYQIPGGIAGAYLLIAFILPGELYAAMVAYSATGLALTIALPIFILLIFTTKMLTKSQIPEPGQVIMERFVWLFFFVFIVYKLVMYRFTSSTIDPSVLFIMLICAVLSFGVFFFHNLYLGIIGGTVARAYSSVLGMQSTNARIISLKRLTKEREELNNAIRKVNARIKMSWNNPVNKQMAEDELTNLQVKLDMINEEMNGLTRSS